MIRRFMYGRYGNDQLNACLLAVYLILLLLSMITRFALLEWIALPLAAWGLFRMFSRNYAARRAENAKFMKLAGPAIDWFRLRRSIHRDREHRYFKCPSCGQQLRVPRGKGRINVTCRSCGAKFEEKS